MRRKKGLIGKRPHVVMHLDVNVDMYQPHSEVNANTESSLSDDYILRHQTGGREGLHGNKATAKWSEAW